MFRLKILVKWEYGWYLKLLNKLDKTREKCGLMFSDELIFKYKKSILKYDIFHISLVIIFLPILAHGEVVGQYVCLWMITRLIWKRLCFILYVLLWDKKIPKRVLLLDVNSFLGVKQDSPYYHVHPCHMAFIFIIILKGFLTPLKDNKKEDVSLHKDVQILVQ